LASGEAQLAAVPAAAEHPELRALLLSNVGTVELWTGEWDDAERTLRRGLVVAAGAGCEYPRLNILGRLALLEFLRGRSGWAEELDE
jgi:LuxR family maltose regulon positive regulatory protein